MECLFCKIASGELPAEIVYEDERCVAFKDINPQAPVHILVIPKRHVGNMAALEEADEALAGHLVRVCAQVAKEAGVEEGGYRVVANVGPDAGESVPHLHLHVLGGRKLAWPPG
jgi:histidine triad (HIT) family protein